MFCGKCGTNIPNGAVVCPTCGNPTGVQKKKPVVGKKLIVAVIALAAVIALVIVLLNSCGGSNTPEGVVEDYWDALVSGDGEKVYEVSNIEALFDIVVDEGEWDKDDLEDVRDELIDYYDDYCDELHDTYEYAYGDDWTLDIKIKKTTELKNSDLRDYEETIEYYFDVEVEIDEGYSIKYTGCFDGEDDSDKYNGESVVLKINGKWVISNVLYRSYYYVD